MDSENHEFIDGFLTSSLGKFRKEKYPPQENNNRKLENIIISIRQSERFNSSQTISIKYISFYKVQKDKLICVIMYSTTSYYNREENFKTVRNI